MHAHLLHRIWVRLGGHRLAGMLFAMLVFTGCGSGTIKLSEIDADGDGFTESDDCDDRNSAINDDMVERCDGVDNNCDGDIDEGVKTLWYADADQDGFGNEAETQESCTQPDGFLPVAGDCDDGQEGINPSALELCDGFDNNCNPDDDVVEREWFVDEDGDSYGTDSTGVFACEGPEDSADQDGDCNDADPNVNPGEPEVCDGQDQNCDEVADEGLLVSTYYADNDGDGWGDDDNTQDDCTQPTGTVATGGDCNDLDETVNPGAVEFCDGEDQDCDGVADNGASPVDWFRDGDGDGYGDPSASVTSCEPPTDYVLDDTDCNDLEATVYPGAPELCNEVDDDCDLSLPANEVDGDVDGFLACNDCDDADSARNPGEAEVCADGIDNDCDATNDAAGDTWYRDDDGDGYGDSGATTIACTDPGGSYVTDGTDCDDTDASQYPGATEFCNSSDDDCDGLIDEPGASGETTWYYDGDGDGYGDPAITQDACSQPVDYVASILSDCDDGDAGVFPGAPETCNGDDDDCDGVIDNDPTDAVTSYPDDDVDGYGDASDPTTDCVIPAGNVLDDTDCDDTDSGANPGEVETCDGVDNDCDGVEDDGLAFVDYFDDDDADGYGDPTDSQNACTMPVGHVLDDTDCNDADATVNPGEAELCDGIDQDCDDTIDDGLALTTYYADGDGDTYGDPAVIQDACTAPPNYVANDEDCNDGDATINPLAAETCDDVDEDCDGTPDNGLATSLYYADNDADSYGDATDSVSDCAAPAGRVTDATDCDDSLASVHPGATEYCDGDDEDCDGTVDDAAVDAATYYTDADADGYGAGAAIVSCDGTGRVLVDGDCDNTDDSVYPGAVEAVADGVDQDCDTFDDCYEDMDGDDYGSTMVVSGTTLDCSGLGESTNNLDCDDDDPVAIPEDNDSDGVSACAGDCDDSDATASPNNVRELGIGEDAQCTDGADNDCDGDVDTSDWDCGNDDSDFGAFDGDGDGITDANADGVYDDDPIYNGVDALWATDTDTDGNDDAIAVFAPIVMADPYDTEDVIFQGDGWLGTFTALNTTFTESLTIDADGDGVDDTWEFSFLGRGLSDGAVSLRVVSEQSSADVTTAVDTSDCSDWEVGDLETFCNTYDDIFCRDGFYADTDGCGFVGDNVLHLAWDSTTETMSEYN